MKLQHVTEKRVFRLGKLDENAERPRPVLVEFHTLAFKNKVLQNASKLKDKEEYKDIYLKHDLTRTQR